MKENANLAKEINKKSWHWELYQLNFLTTENSKPYDWCSYVRTVFGGMISVLLIVGFFVVLGASIMADLCTLVGSLYYSEFLPFMPVTFFFTDLLLFLALVYFLTSKIELYINRLLREIDVKAPEAGLFADAWKAHKEKYCVRVEIIDEK